VVFKKGFSRGEETPLGEKTPKLPGEFPQKGFTPPQKAPKKRWGLLYQKGVLQKKPLCESAHRGPFFFFIHIGAPALKK